MNREMQGLISAVEYLFGEVEHYKTPIGLNALKLDKLDIQGGLFDYLKMELEAAKLAQAQFMNQVPPVLAGCHAALIEAGKDFARANPHAARPNLYALHAKRVGEISAKFF